MQKVQGGLGRGLGSLLPTSSMATAPVMMDVRAPVVERASRAVASLERSADALSNGSSDLHAQLAQDGNPSIAQAKRSLNEQLLHVSVNDIVANPRQPRTYFAEEDLTDLMASVKEHGVLQPLIVTVRPDGKYELIAGERRLRSARAIGLSMVPVVVRDASDQQKLEIALIENIQRSDLNAVEEARAYRSLMDEFDLTQEDVAGRVGKGRSHIANTVRLLDLATDMLAAVIDGRISKSHARTLLSEQNEERRRALFEKMLNGGVSVRSAEAAVSPHRASEAKDPNIVALEETLRERLGTKVSVDAKGPKSTITIYCYSPEDLREMVRTLGA